jgi:DeoR/GlpR family transcriptional regulator of sugar metabolism
MIFCGFLLFFVICDNQNMLKKERQTFIEKQINLHNKVLLNDLSQVMQVSEDTIRRDLNELAEDGKIIKVHGGALSKSFHLFTQGGLVYSLDAKKLIASKAATLVKDGMFVLTSGGTTMIELAKALPRDLKATFITVSLPAAYQYVQHPNIEVIFIGDKINKSAQLSVGAEVVNRLGQLKPDLCFMGVNALDVTHGITDNDWEVVQVKKAMVACSAQLVCLSISEKLNSFQRIRICDIGEVDTLITELSPKEELLQPYQAAGLHIL